MEDTIPASRTPSIDDPRDIVFCNWAHDEILVCLMVGLSQAEHSFRRSVQGASELINFESVFV
jgi:hypothetical protein